MEVLTLVMRLSLQFYVAFKGYKELATNSLPRNYLIQAALFSAFYLLLGAAQSLAAEAPPARYFYVLLYAIIIFFAYVNIRTIDEYLHNRVASSAKVNLSLVLSSALFGLVFALAMNQFMFNAAEYIFSFNESINLLRAAISEEVLFRVGILSVLLSIFVEKRNGILTASIINSSLFSLLHFRSDQSIEFNVLYLVFMFLLGMLSCFYTLKHGVVTAILGHFAFNFVAAVIYMYT